MEQAAIWVCLEIAIGPVLVVSFKTNQKGVQGPLWRAAISNLQHRNLRPAKFLRRIGELALSRASCESALNGARVKSSAAACVGRGVILMSGPDM